MLNMQHACDEAILQAAKQICMAAITAPKACGRDSVTCGILTGDEIQRLVEEMVRLEQEVPNCRPIFIRDSELVARCPAVVLLGSKRQSRGLPPCGLCGHKICGDCRSGGGSRRSFYGRTARRGSGPGTGVCCPAAPPPGIWPPAPRPGRRWACSWGPPAPCGPSPPPAAAPHLR